MTQNTGKDLITLYKLRALAFSAMAGVGLFGITLMTSSTAYGQVSISDGGVTFPDDTEQTSAVIVPTDCPHAESIVWDINSESWVCERDLSPISYAVGDIGPAGGTVFWTTQDGLHGLEAAPFDLGMSIWGCPADSISGAVGIAIGTGAQNTVDINRECIEDERLAAQLVVFYSLNGFDDWFLPSKDELNQLFLERLVVEGLGEEPYWSSSKALGGAWAQNFGSFGPDPPGYQEQHSRGINARVRAVRAF